MRDIIVSEIKMPAISIDTGKIADKETAIINASRIKEVLTAKDQENAVECMKEVKALTRGIEASRKIVKEPILEIGRKIDATAKEYCAELDEEFRRIDKMVSEFNKKQAEMVEKARRDAEDLRKKAAEEERRKMRELEEKASSEKNAAKKLAIYQEQEEAERKARAAVEKTLEMELEARPSRVKGMVFKKVWKHEVTDINALFKAAPHAVKLEVNDMVIRGLIAGGLREMDGLRIYEETSTTVRG